MQDTGYRIQDITPLYPPLARGELKGGIMHHALCIMHLALILLFTIHCSLFTDIASAAKDPNEEYKKLQKDIDTHKRKLEKAKKMEHSVLGELDRTNKDLSRTQAELRKYIGKRKVTEHGIRKVEAEIAVNKAKLEKQTEWLKRKLRVMQKHGYYGDVVILLSTSEDIAQLMRRWRYIKELAGHDHKMLNSYKETIKNLAEQEDRLKTLHAELKKSEEKIQTNERAIAEKKRGKEILLSSVRKEKSSYEKMLKELKEASNRLMEIIRRSEEAEAYVAKGFHNLKGRLPWPVNGKVVIPYGAQKDPQFNTPVFRNGIYIKADDNTSAKVVHGGKVVFADWFKGYGQLVIISHGEGYHTLYANLAEIFYKVGDIIKGQQAIGKVGESGTMNAPGLYFEVRYKGKPLDPMQWLKKR